MSMVVIRPLHQYSLLHKNWRDCTKIIFRDWATKREGSGVVRPRPGYGQ
jgi:isoleucyl-tRNA synthetase